jgi:hypothetical protein
VLIPFIFLSFGTLSAQEKLPVIDMHLHAHGADLNGPPPTTICAPPEEMPHHDPDEPWASGFQEWLQDSVCPTAITGAKNNEELKQKTLSLLDSHNIYAVTSGPYVNDYKKAGGKRILPGLSFNFFNSDLTPEKLHGLLASGAYRVFGEVGIQYNGISPSDSIFDPYAAVAEDLDIPMGIHIGTGPPGAPYLPGLQNYRASLHSPLVVENLLLRHPRLRIYLMHAGYPMIDDLLAVMWTHPQVYVDVGIICYAIPRAAFHNYLRKIVEAGFGKRIMFGSDQMNWPEAIEVGIEAIESAAFLTSEQKRDILYNNAARFLRLTAAEINSHHHPN